MEVLSDLLKNVCKARSVHILADSSKRDVERHAIQVTFWDDGKEQPVTVRVQIQKFVEFGEIFFDQEFAWSEKDDKDYGLGAGFRYFKLPFRAALREVTLKAMHNDVVAAFAKTFKAVETEKSKVEEPEQFYQDRLKEVQVFVEEFRATLMKNSAERVWKPTVLWGCLAEPSIEKNVADVLLTHVFNQQPDELFQPCELANSREQEAWDLLKDKIKSKSTEMRKVWTNDWKFELASDDTRRYLDELIDLRSGVSSLLQSRGASLRNKIKGAAEKVSMPRWLRLFQSMYFSIRHHSQTTEEVFKHVDDLRNCTNLGLDRLAARVLCRINQVQPDLHEARKAHVPIAGRTDKTKKAEERRTTLKRTSDMCRRITNSALASATKHYTREAMEHVRSARRPAAREKRRHEADSFVEKHSADEKHWGAKVRTASATNLTERAAAMPLLKKMKEDKEGKSVLEGKINAVKQIFKQRNLTHVIKAAPVDGAKAKQLTGDELMKSVWDYLETLEEEKRNKIIEECCDKHEEISSVKALNKASKAAASSTSNPSVTAPS
jgi:2-hydroxychromene-2-carboxylate isomerase